jgi:hypothetical protein
MTADLQTKLNAKFAATSSLTDAFTGNLWADGTTYALYWGAANKGTATPFLVCDVASIPAPTTAYPGVAFGDYYVQFKAVGEGMLATVGLIETLIGVFDNFRPTLASGTVTNVLRQGDALPMKLPPEEQTGADEWQVMVTYLYTLAP